MHSGARRLSIRSCSTEKRPISWGRHPRAPDTGGLHSAGPAQFRPRPPSVPSVVPSADGRLCPASSRGLLSVQVPSWCRLLLLEGRLSLWWRTPPAPCCSALIPSLKVPSPHTFGHWGEGFQHKPLGDTGRPLTGRLPRAAAARMKGSDNVRPWPWAPARERRWPCPRSWLRGHVAVPARSGTVARRRVEARARTEVESLGPCRYSGGTGCSTDQQVPGLPPWCHS